MEISETFYLFIFHFCGYVVGVYIYGLHDILIQHAVCNYHIMKNEVSIPSGIYPLCFKQFNYIVLVSLKCAIT